MVKIRHNSVAELAALYRACRFGGKFSSAAIVL
jgi:hypothetical protein